MGNINITIINFCLDLFAIVIIGVLLIEALCAGNLKYGVRRQHLHYY